MAFILTFRQFLQNPTGPYSAFFGKRAEIIKNLEDRFAKLISTRSKDFSCKVYTDKENYFFHITIPSETFKDMKYDVVFKMMPSNEGCESESSLSNYKLQFFSNSPAFIFTYAYVFNKDGNLINFLTNKIDSKALDNEPEIKNPVQIYGYEKSLYFALLYIKYKYYNLKTNLLSMQKKLDKKEILSNVKDSQTVLLEYKKLKKIEEEKKRIEKEKEKHKKQREKQKEIIEKNKKRKTNKIIKPKKKL